MATDEALTLWITLGWAPVSIHHYYMNIRSLIINMNSWWSWFYSQVSLNHCRRQICVSTDASAVPPQIEFGFYSNYYHHFSDFHSFLCVVLNSNLFISSTTSNLKYSSSAWRYCTTHYTGFSKLTASSELVSTATKTQHRGTLCYRVEK